MVRRQQLCKKTLFNLFSYALGLHDLHYLAQGRGVAFPPLDEDAEHNLVFKQIVISPPLLCVGAGDVARGADGAAQAISVSS